MLVRTFAATLICVVAPAAAAQSYSPLDVRGWGIVYEVPAMRQVAVKRDIPFHASRGRTLQMDVFNPPGVRPGERRPAVVFLNGVGDDGNDRMRKWAIYQTWARLVAAHGLVGIVMDADGDSVVRSIEALFTKITGPQARALGIDSTRIGLYAASANVSGAVDYLQGNNVSPAVRAVVLYYGGVPEQPLFRIPTLMVVAQGDAPRMRPHLDSLWKAVVDSAAPWTLMFARGLPHAFDAVTDNDDARRTIQQTLAFWKSNLEALPVSRAETPLARRIVESTYSGDNALSARLLGEWVEKHPSDTMALQMMGRALSSTGRAPEAEAAFRRALALDTNSVAARVGLGAILFNNRRWEEAATMIDGAIRRGWETSLMQGQLGYAHLNLQRNAEAARAYERAFELGIPPGRNTTGVAAYNLASAYARLGRTDDAMAMLTRAVDNGITNRATIENDEDFTSLRNDPRYRSLLERMRPPG